MYVILDNWSLGLLQLPNLKNKIKMYRPTQRRQLDIAKTELQESNLC